MLRSVDVHDHPGREVVAGITVAAVAVPGVIGYAHIAGMPIVTGLYTMIIPATVFVVLCSSRHLVVGADSTTAAILAAGLTPLAAVGSAEYVELAAMVAILTGAMLLVARLAGLGFISDFLSRTLLIGFLAGVGVQVAVGQLPAALGVPVTATGPVPTLVALGGHLSEVVATDVALSVASIAVMAVGGWLRPQVPWPLLVVVAGTTASATGAIDVATIPDVTGGLPLPSWPATGDLDRVASLVPIALTCFVVVLAQSSATARAYAERHGERVDTDMDLVALGAANLAAGFTGTFVVNGSPTRTEVMHGAGGRNQVAQLVAAAVTVVVLLVAGPVLTDLPVAVLASVVAMIAIRLIDLPAIVDVFHRRRVEGAVVIATAVTVIAAGVGPGILFAMGLSVVVHLRHSYRPNVRALGRDRDRWRMSRLEHDHQIVPGLAAVFPSSNLYYANATHIADEVLEMVDAARPPLRWLCVLAIAVDDVDLTASEVLGRLHGDLAARGVTLVLCGLEPHVRHELERDGLIERIGPQHVFDYVEDAVAAYRAL